jgi:hypothetical protein
LASVEWNPATLILAKLGHYKLSWPKEYWLAMASTHPHAALLVKSKAILEGSNIPSDVKGFTNATMAWMPESGHGMDGRLADATWFTLLALVLAVSLKASIS